MPRPMSVIIIVSLLPILSATWPKTMPPSGLARRVSEYDAKTRRSLATRLVGGKKYSPSTEAMNRTRVRSKTSTIQPSMPPSMALAFMALTACLTTLVMGQGTI